MLKRHTESRCRRNTKITKCFHSRVKSATFHSVNTISTTCIIIFTIPGPTRQALTTKLATEIILLPHDRHMQRSVNHAPTPWLCPNIQQAKLTRLFFHQASANFFRLHPATCDIHKGNQTIRQFMQVTMKHFFKWRKSANAYRRVNLNLTRVQNGHLIFQSSRDRLHHNARRLFL